jgi:ring-1,2-phenylacetyl-CoA epoxidase subunit PaaD
MLSPDEVYGVLNSVMDPEVPVISVVELGIVSDVAILNDAVTITITPTYSGCPAMREIEADIRTALVAHGVRDVSVKLVLSPAWTTDWRARSSAPTASPRQGAPNRRG